ncbi:hypothetical protein MIMGU_mgv1a002769mg [Erythranthe guttata]|uniref:Uncharacterized protein n=1 Tax=Erythranthe guttata TaxID=4155 RepID=A0A022S3H3_ERYGU|nr:hypothetical protein MIMGU_mgv1a002769mg [Erythranthe guttata]
MVQACVSEFEALAASRCDLSATRSDISGDLLSLRMNYPLCKLSGHIQGSTDRDDADGEEVVFPTTAKLPLIERIPSYTTWMFLDRYPTIIIPFYFSHFYCLFLCYYLIFTQVSFTQHRNQRMADDQSVVGRRRIYYDQHGSEALICSDSEEELGQPEGDLAKNSAEDSVHTHKASEEEGRNLSAPYATEQEHHRDSKGGGRIIIEPNLASDDSLSSSNKKLKLTNLNTLVDNVFRLDDLGTNNKGKDITEPTLNQPHNSMGKLAASSHVRSEWKPFEKDLYLKGLEIFGRNSCFIARNLLPGLKTCKEVSAYMYADGEFMSGGSSAMPGSFFEDFGKAYMDRMEIFMPVKSRICRKRGRVRKVKSSWKSAGHPSLWRRVVDGKDEPYKQYSPCACHPLCGKDCPCLQKGTCCEKYCGCSKSCKNRFRGCHCAKSQCKSRQCPCFAAGRECDPDVCRNCWISCGDGSLGEPPRRGESQCGNMKLLLRQQQRILLSKSDVAGWGAFVKNSVNKNDYLGEYTGELISHQEADKRGKIYDRANSSFLFDLNDKYVLDAYRKGDKLKFANHSAAPNCYAKVMLVAGDHRVGIYANEHIQSGEELFYDYRYGPDQAPPWARRPDTSKRDDSPLHHQGRAKKHQSG